MGAGGSMFRSSERQQIIDYIIRSKIKDGTCFWCFLHWIDILLYNLLYVLHFYDICDWVSYAPYPLNTSVYFNMNLSLIPYIVQMKLIYIQVGQNSTNTQNWAKRSSSAFPCTCTPSSTTFPIRGWLFGNKITILKCPLRGPPSALPTKILTLVWATMWGILWPICLPSRWIRLRSTLAKVLRFTLRTWRFIRVGWCFRVCWASLCLLCRWVSFSCYMFCFCVISNIILWLWPWVLSFTCT